jgi:hypothetical protein
MKRDGIVAEVIGPYRVLTTPSGGRVPWYIIPFDKQGRCKSPNTRAHLLDELASGGYSHVFLFSHGWNNDWKAASEGYADFIEGYARMHEEYGLEMPEGYRPLLIGIIWPSASLVLPWEKAPKFAAGGDLQTEDLDILARAEDEAISDLADDLFDENVPRLYELLEGPSLDAAGARELAELIAPVLRPDDELGDSDSPTAEGLAEAWLAARTLETDDEDEDDESFGTAVPVEGDPQAASILNKLDPRQVLRMVTVWRMKDRAGTIGAIGVSPLLKAALDSSGVSLHMIGHSYGAKVTLSAISQQPLSRPVTSALLLQPAVNHRCFAADADGKGHPGGYRVALNRVKQPIVTTFSSHDFPLTKVFHKVVRRRSDLGEQRIAAGAPSRFAALGGFGPGGVDHFVRTMPIHDVGTPYSEIANEKLEILALESSRTIGGHGEISNPSTWWVLYEQVRLS